MQPRILYPARLSFKIEGEIKSFPEKQNKAKQKKPLTCKERHITFRADLSIDTWQAREEWEDILNMLNQKNMQPRILYPARLSFRIEGEIKIFPDK